MRHRGELGRGVPGELEPGGLGLPEVGEGAVDRLDRLRDEEGAVSVVAVGVAREGEWQQREAGRQQQQREAGQQQWRACVEPTKMKQWFG